MPLSPVEDAVNPKNLKTAPHPFPGGDFEGVEPE